MKADASHPNQVRDLLAEATAIVSSPLERQRVTHLHEEAMGLVEDHEAASQVAWGQWLEEQQEMADLGLVRVPADDDEVGV